MKRADQLLFLTALAAIALAYALMAPAHVIGNDNGEFITLMHEGGVAHPPGYPLYILYLRAMRWVPGTNPAHSAALATALLGLAAAAALYAAARAWAASPSAALLTMLVYALSPLTWKLSVQAEVFALNALLCAALLIVCGPQSPTRGGARIVAIGAIAGLGAAHHHTLSLLAPVAVFGLGLGWRESEKPARALLLSAVAFAAGLALYATTYARSAQPGGWVWAPPMDMRLLARHFFRAEYGTFQLASPSAQASAVAQVLALLHAIVFDLAVFVPLVAVLGGAVLLRERRAGVIPVLLSLVLAGPLFVSRFRVLLVGPQPQITERFYLLPELLVCLLFSLAVTRFVPRIPRALIVGAAGVLTLVSVGRVREYLRPTIDLYARNILAQVPAHAVILGSGDHCVFGFLYLQDVIRLRPDVTYAHLSMLDRAWYRARLEQRFPDVDWSAKGRALVESALAHHAVYLTEPFSTPIVTWFPSYPEGALVRVLPVGSPTKDPAQLEQLNDKIYSAYHWEPTVPPNPNTWNGLVQDAYARAWLSISDMYQQLGYDEQAKATLLRGSLYVPWLAVKMHPGDTNPLMH